MKKLATVLLILPLLAIGQSVKGTFSPAKDFTHAFLYEATPQGANYVNHGELNTEGKFEIKIDSSAAPGIYKIVYAIPPEENNFDFIYDGKETVAFKFSQENGVEFTESEENKLWASYLKSMDMVNQTIANYYEKDGKDKEGNDRYSTGVVANNYGGVQILGGGESSMDTSAGMNQAPKKEENLNQTVEDDDLPF